MGDVERAALGVPSLAELRAEAERANRALAVERADRLGLPADSVRADLDRSAPDEPNDAGMPRGRRYGPTATPSMRCAAGHPGVMFGPVFQMPMWRVGDEDMFALMVRRRLPEAVFSYSFWPIDAAGRGPPELRRGEYVQLRRTPGRASNRGAAGDDLRSRRGERRSVSRVVTVYRPPGHERSETSRSCMPPTAGCSPPTPAAPTRPSRPAWSPVLVVAAHSAGFRHGNLRALEYLPGFDDDRFDRHASASSSTSWPRAEASRALTDRSGGPCSGARTAGATPWRRGGVPTGPLRPRDRLLDRDGARTG